MAAVQQKGGRNKRRLNAEINVVPYIDVMLVLLIIFMITAPLMTQGVEVELPETASEAITTSDEPATLSVDASGAMFLKSRGASGDAALSDDEVVKLASDIVREKPQEMFLVDGDKAASYEYVARAMSLLQSAGVKKIGFVTDPISTPTSPK